MVRLGGHRTGSAWASPSPGPADERDSPPSSGTASSPHQPREREARTSLYTIAVAKPKAAGEVPKEQQGCKRCEAKSNPAQPNQPQSLSTSHHKHELSGAAVTSPAEAALKPTMAS